MYRRFAIKLHKKKVEFINCINITERIKKARALPSGVSHLGVVRCVVSSAGVGKKNFVEIKNCK